jgi:riboflavin synthase
MFTGIVEEVGKISKITRKSGSWQLGVVCKLVYPQVEVSGSVAVDGVCLTVVKKERNVLYFDVVDATLKRTSLKRLRVSSKVNLEASLIASDRMEGHFVLGHVDCEARIRRIVKTARSLSLEIELPAEGRKYAVDRGSIALDGISLTVAEVKPRSFVVNIIPYTWEKTNLQSKKAGSFVNLEFDYLAKVALGK